jgi:hypothetical protein
MSRHGRQTRLAEVGAAGQARIVAATIDVPMDGLSGEVAARYLAGAGVGCVRVRSSAIAAAARSVDPAVRVEIATDTSGEGPRDDRRGLGSSSSRDPPLDLRDAVARDLALGARAALRALRAVLEGAS